MKKTLILTFLITSALCAHKTEIPLGEHGQYGILKIITQGDRTSYTWHSAYLAPGERAEAQPFIRKHAKGEIVLHRIAATQAMTIREMFAAQEAPGSRTF